MTKSQIPNSKSKGVRFSTLGLGIWVLGVGIFFSSCAARRVALPADPGTPLPDFEQVHAQVSAPCAAVRTMTAELGLSGRAGSQRLRGRVISGFERPGSMRLEGVAPFGAPAFILAARGDAATLLLPRDNRVVRGARAEEILDALTGVALPPSDLQAILTGCVTAQPRATNGRIHRNGWASIDLEGGATIYLRRDEAWEPVAARRGGWQIDYPSWQGGFPETVRLRSDAQRAEVDLTVDVSQRDTNIEIDAAAFAVDVPPGTREMTIDELRAAGPLRGQ